MSIVDGEILQLHRQLAAERLRADQGWQRYEEKNRECNQLREQLANLNSAFFYVHDKETGLNVRREFFLAGDVRGIQVSP